MFSTDYDPESKLLTIEVGGHFTPDDAGALGQTLAKDVSMAREQDQDFNVLVDSTAFAVQAQHVADLLTSVMARGMAQTKGRAAVIVGGHLNRMQAERTLVHPRLRVFLDRAAAMDWLQESPEADGGTIPT